MTEITNAAIGGIERVQARHGGSHGDLVSSLARPLPQVRIDGPYGAPTRNVFDNQAAVLIGAGIGVYPPNPPLPGSYNLCRCHTFCFRFEAHLVLPKERQPRFPPSRRVLLDLS